MIFSDGPFERRRFVFSPFALVEGFVDLTLAGAFPEDGFDFVEAGL